jgi:hypothetical protein
MQELHFRPTPSPALLPLPNKLGTPANLVDSQRMTRIFFRQLPGVAAIERQLDLHARGHLPEEELEELPHIIDDTSSELFGITRNDTLYGALPEPVRVRFSRAEWESHFDVLGQYSRDPNAHWQSFDLDLRCEQGRSLHCLEVFGRQLICSLGGLHPNAYALGVHPGGASSNPLNSNAGATIHDMRV